MVDTSAIQETRLTDSKRKKDFTFFWHRKSWHVDKGRKHGVGFAVKNTLLQSMAVGSDGNNVLQLLHAKKGTSNLFSVYAH